MWDKPEYPFSNLWVYERKGKYCKDTLFLTMNSILSRGYIFNRSSFSKKPRRFKKWAREFVYDIPWHRVLYIDIDTELNKEMIEIYS